MNNIKFYPYSREVIANQWFKNGDHPNDRTVNRLNEGKVVKRLKATKTLESNKPCPLCKYLPKDHGLLNNSVDGERLVCPGDYIETVKSNRKTEYRLHKKKFFERYFTRDKPKEIENED